MKLRKTAGSIKKMGIIYAAEFKKLFHKKEVYVYFFVIPLLLIFVAVFSSGNGTNIMDGLSEDENWMQVVTQFIYSLLGGRGGLREAQLVYEYDYYLQNGLQPPGNLSASFFIVIASMFFMITFCVVIMVASKMITEEYNKNTVNVLVTLPVKRWKVFTVKYLSILTFAVIACVFTLLMTILIGWIFFGFDTFSVPYVLFRQGSYLVMPAPVLGLVMMLHGMTAIIFCLSLVVFSAVLFKNGIMSCMLGIGIYLIGFYITTSIGDNSAWLAYTPFANMEFSIYIFSEHPAYFMTPLFSSLILLGYSVPFIAASYLIFNRQDI